MKKNKMIKEILSKHYSVPMCNRILRGERKPSYENMCVFNTEYKIPFTAWKDIKSFLKESMPKDEVKD